MCFFFVVVFLLFDISINLYHVWIYKFACTFLLQVQISEPKRLTKQHFCVVKIDIIVLLKLLMVTNPFGTSLPYDKGTCKSFNK